MKIILLILVVVVLAVVFTRWQAGKYADFKSTAKEAQATVTLRDEQEPTDRKNRRHERVLEYRFMLDGREFTGRDTVEYEDLWDDLLLGDVIRVYYDPRNPSKNAPAILLDRRLQVGGKD